MSAVETLEAAQAAGVRVGIEGAALVIEASNAPTEELLSALRRDKAEILILLRESATSEEDIATESSKHPDLYGLTVEEVQEAAGEDWPMVRTVLRPTVQAAVTLQEFGKHFGDLDLSGLIDSLTEQTRVTAGGDLKRGKAMLTAQAHTLDTIFNNLARRAINAEYMDHLDRYLKLALRAQSQCRATWETLSTIKNPPIVGYVRQANIAHGHQQVNNTPSTESEASRVRENPNLQNKLLEEKDGEQLDTRTTGTAGRADPAMATLGEVDRAKDPGR